MYSFILTNHRVYYLEKSNSFKYIIKRFGLNKDHVIAVQFTKPKNNKHIQDASKWQFKIVQEKFPSWSYDPYARIEVRARNVLEERLQKQYSPLNIAPKYVNWKLICFEENLDESFLRKYFQFLDFKIISQYQKLSEEFIRDFQKQLSWWEISFYQELSENFIREFANKVCWNCIFSSQKLSKKFIKEFDIEYQNFLYPDYNDE